MKTRITVRAWCVSTIMHLYFTLLNVQYLIFTQNIKQCYQIRQLLINLFINQFIVHTELFTYHHVEFHQWYALHSLKTISINYRYIIIKISLIKINNTYT